MRVDFTEVQKNPGKYLVLVTKEDIIITRDDIPLAILSAIKASSSESDLVMAGATEFAGSGWKATYDDFLELTKDNEERFEYIDGEIYLLASPKIPHQLASSELFGVFFTWFQGKKCRPLSAPCDITLRRHPEDINIVQPDLIIICDLEEKLGSDGYYKGVPALVVEILSESTWHKDLSKKLDLYQSSGIGEYWIVDPENREITVYHFIDKKIDEHRTYQKGEIAQSYLFDGLTADLGKIF